MAARGSAGTQRGRGDAGRGRGEKSTPKTPAKEETDDDNRSWEVTTETTPARRTSEENVEVVAEEGRGRAPGEAERQGLRDPWLEDQGDPWSEDRWWEGSRRGWQEEWGSRWGSNDWWSNDRNKDYSDPPSWAGWAHYRLWRKAVTRWDTSTDIKMHRRADRIFKSMDWDLQARFEHLSDGDLTDHDYLSRILSVLDVLAGEKQSTEKRRAVRKALFEGSRRGDESLSQFALRREQEFAMAERYVTIPSDLKAILLEENAALGKQGVMNLRTLTSGTGDFDTVVKALKVLDTEEEGISTKAKGSHFVGHAASSSDVPQEETLVAEEVESSSMASQDWQEIMQEVEKMDLDEHQVTEVFVAMEKEKRTWKENKKLKLARRKDRRHFSGGLKKNDGRERGDQRPSVDQMKRISRCGNCGEKGHWAEDCVRPYRSKADRLAQEASARNKVDKSKKVAFVFLGGGEEDSQRNTFVGVEVSEFNGMAIPDYVMEILDKHRVRTQGPGEELGKSGIFLTIPAGHAIIDPGAGQDLIGAPSYGRLKQQLAQGGLQPVQIEEKPASASGVGGKATTLFQALIPCILGGAPGVVKVTVVAEDIPHLLSIGLLESAGSVINTQTNQIQFENIGTEDKMVRLRSGHRVVDVSKWDGQPFPVPQEVQDKYGISDGAFNLKDGRSHGAYMSGHGSSAGEEDWWNVPGTTLLVKIHQEARKKLYNPMHEKCAESWHEQLGERRVTICQQATGEVSCFADEWRKKEGVSLEQEWHGITIFTKDHDHGKLCPSLQCFSSSSPRNSCDRDQHSSFCLLHGGAEDSSFMSQCYGRGTEGEEDGSALGGAHEGQREGGELRPPGGLHCRRGQPVWQMATVPSLSNEDIIHPTPGQAGEEEEGEAGGGGVRDEGDPEGAGGCPVEVRVPTREEGDSLGINRSEGAARDADRVKPSASIWNDFLVGTGIGSGGAGAASSHGDVAAGHDGPGSYVASYASRSGGTDASSAASREDTSRGSRDGLGQGGRGGTASSVSEPDGEESPLVSDETGSGDSGAEAARGEMQNDGIEGEAQYDVIEGEEMRREEGSPAGLMQVKSDNFYKIGQAAGGLTECEAFMSFQQEHKIAFKAPELRKYVDEEDINDDYEASIPKNVKKATLNFLEAAGRSLPEEPGRKRGFKIMELFSPPRVTRECRRFGCTTTRVPAYDLDCGWDFFSAKDRKAFWQALEEEDPDLVVMSPECRAFSQMMNVNWEKMDPEEARRIQVQGMAMFQFCIRVADHQLQKGKWFLLEQPLTASSWRTQAARWLERQDGVMKADLDQCAFNLRLGPLQQLVRKATSFMTNHLGIYIEFMGKRCSGDHEHLHLEGGNLTRQAQVWPAPMVQHILRGVHKERRRRNPEIFAVEPQEGTEVEIPKDEEDEEEAEEDAGQEEGHNRVREEQGISDEQKQMVHRLHVNLGHLPLDRMKIMLKAANAKEEVMVYVRDKYSCEVCMRQRREITRRKAAFPRTFEFNRILGIDTFFVKWQGKSLPFLNMVDHGSNWQVVVLVRPVAGDHAEPSGGNPSAEETWLHFLRHWVRPHGTPDVVISDGGMEFRGRFERGLEQYGVLQNVTDQESPWQNGRVERHGLWVKERMEMEISSAGSVVSNVNDLEALVIELVSCKNCWFSRGGYSPAQLVYGKNPRLPAELLSDAGQTTAGWDEALCDATEGDTATAEFRRSHLVREKARKLAMESSCREKVREAAKPPLHKHRSWAAGQWVMIWRTSKTATVRSRWVGPGVVILQNGHTVYVAVRSRLWKCNVDQLRPANEMEELGMQVVQSRQYQDLLQQMQQQRQGAVDVEREGPPPPDAWRRPVHRTEGAPALSLPNPGLPPEEAGERERRREDVGREHHILRERPDPVPQPPLVMGPRGLPLMPREEVRRGSHSTVSEPASEPRGQGEDTEAKRRRILPPLPEAQDEGRERESAATSTTQPPPTGPQQLVRSRAQEIEERLEEERARREEARVGRRRSRSPLPFTMRREREEIEAECEETSVPDSGAGTNLIGYVSGTREERQSFKEACRRRNHHESDEDLVDGEGTYWAALSTTSGNWAVTEAPRNGEISWSQMTPEEVVKFKESDLAEWRSLENEFKAVKVWKGKQAEELRRIYKNRIMTARVVRRKKPMPGLHQFKPKSRFCVHGHRDPDGGSFKTFAPTPSAEAFHMVCQTITNARMHLLFADVKAAFAQSNPLKRPQGRLFVTPCDGTPLEAQDLIELIAPVYGLDDAPIRWYETVCQLLRQLGYQKSLLDPCVFILHEDGGLKSLILLEVDDFCIASIDKKTEDWIKKELQAKFQFGKWEVGEADFIGRHVKKVDGEIRFDQEKYIIEKIQPIHLNRGRRGRKEESLEDDEFKEYRSALYKVSWVAHQTRPEVAGAVAILASRLHKATIQDAITLNKAIGHLRSSSKQELRIRPFDPEKMTFIGVSDAGGVDGEVRGNGEDGLIEDPVQGAWLILASDAMPCHDKKIKVSILSWRSSKLKRRVTSTMSGETLSLSLCLGELEWMQIFYRDLMFHDVEVTNWSRSISPFIAMLPEKCTLRGRQEQGSVTDAKSLYDAIYKRCPTSRQDRRNALELAVVIDVVEKTGSQIRWTPHQRMPVDMLTKADVTASNGALLHLIRGASLKIDREDEEMLRRQRSKAARSRTRKATDELLEEEAEECEFIEILNQILWST